MTFVAPSHFFTQRISIDVIGAGGTGSYLLSYLAQIHYLLRMVGGNDNPFDVTVWDRDTVSETNVGRQNFWPMDIGLPKAEVLRPGQAQEASKKPRQRQRASRLHASGALPPEARRGGLPLGLAPAAQPPRKEGCACKS